jgi:hypothetical protein
MSKGVAKWALVALTGAAFTRTLLLPGGQGTGPWGTQGGLLPGPVFCPESSSRGVAHYPALLAIYALYEPLDREGSYVPVEQQRELYQLLMGMSAIYRPC